MLNAGQDQVAVIKRQLQLCLPGICIFLDVDDLMDVSALETYISQTSVILIFLSDAYFRRCINSCALRAVIAMHERVILLDFALTTLLE